MGFINRLIDIILLTQPLLATSIFLSFLIDKPPLYISWIIALLPFPLRLLRNIKVITHTSFDIPILIFVCGLLVGYIVSPKSYLNFEALNTYLACVLIYYGIVNNAYADKKYWTVFGILILLVICGISLLTFICGTNYIYFFNEFLYGIIKSVLNTNVRPIPYLTHNAAGFVLGISLIFLLSVIIFHNSFFKRLLCMLIFIILFTLFILVGSGVSWFCFILTVLLLIFFRNPWSATVSIPLFILGLLLFLFFWQKTDVLSTMIPLTSITSRLTIWQITLKIIAEHPLTGCGLGEWFNIFNTILNSTVINPHNSYLQLVADIGILGVIAIIFSYVIFSRITIKILTNRINKMWHAITIGCICTIIMGFFHAFMEVTTSSVIISDNIMIHYIGIPAIWIVAAVLIVALNNLSIKTASY